MAIFRFIARIGASSAIALALSAGAQMSQPTMSNSPIQNPTGRTSADPRATDPMSPEAGDTQRLRDADFIRKMVKGNQAEVDAGNLAVKNGSSEEVKNFGQKMVDDHTAMLKEITKVAQDMKINVSPAASSKDQAKMAKMAAMRGTEFDRAYVEDMVKDHKADVGELKQESMDGSTPEVKDAAAKALPIVQGHLEMIEGIQKNMMSAGSKSK